MLAIIPGALPSQKFYLSFSFLFWFFSAIHIEISGMFCLKNKKEKLCYAYIKYTDYNKMIKQTVKLAVHIQKISGLNMLQFEVTVFCHV